MASRKQKKIIYTQKIAFLCWYRSLNINDKIAFKTWIYYWGRGRNRLRDLFAAGCWWWQLGPVALKNAITDGHDLLQKRRFNRQTITHPKAKELSKFKQ